MIPLAAQHPDTTAFQSAVRACTPDGVILEESYFYASSGGQPADRGVLRISDREYPVLDVRKDPQGILHVIGPHTLTPGAAVDGRIDAQWRMRIRRMHTAMHVLCAVLERAEGTHITGNQIGFERSRLDVDMEQYAPEKIAEYIAQANARIAQDLPVRRSITTREELMRNPQLVKLAAGFPPDIHEVHLIEIVGVDCQPCGGTHVDNTRAIGRIVLQKAENRGKNNRRIYFTLTP